MLVPTPPQTPAFDMSRLMKKRQSPWTKTATAGPYDHDSHGLAGLAHCWRCGHTFHKQFVPDPAWCPRCGAIGG